MTIPTKRKHGIRIRTDIWDKDKQYILTKLQTILAINFTLFTAAAIISYYISLFLLPVFIIATLIHFLIYLSILKWQKAQTQ